MTKQRLYLPINFNNALTYYSKSRNQYGIYIEGNRKLLISSGKGRVKSTGFSSELGYFVCVAYEHVTCRTEDNLGTVIVRYCHLKKVLVKNRKSVDAETILGIVKTNGGLHNSFLLYIEPDKDIQYPCHTPSLLTCSGDLKAGLRGELDTTFDPLLALHNSARHEADFNLHV